MVLVRFRAWLLGGVYTAGSMALVVGDQGRLLLVKPWYRRGWGFPGGMMKRGEQSADALRRELLEETGIEVTPGDFHDVYVQNHRRHIDHLYVVRLNGEPEPRWTKRGEITDAGWYYPDELPPLQREAHEALQKLAKW
jgi:8-oxo-dGTP pyrophosphatase MutT (NUDIX family)